ncbi:MAG: hypothetical protein LW878_04260 [Proteobacteria bacterium]|jgi:hypothetical protein|nr:hypothetical protein [Pseudomonadota bacterium]
MSTFLNLAVEMAVLVGLALLYYFYQRHRILHGPRHWRKRKLTELHAMALSCATPDEFPELHLFLDELEDRMQNNRELDQTFLANWRERPLPENLKHLLHECWEWSTYQA